MTHSDYEVHGLRHGFSKLYEEFTELKVTPLPIEPKPRNFRLAIVRWLKWYDSHVLWEEISRHKLTFVPEHVTWGKEGTGQERTIAGYLDFHQTTRNGYCAAVYRAALARTLGVLPPNMFQMYPVDRLTMTLLRDIHSAEVYEPAKQMPASQVALGSVLVSGSTLEASATRCLDLHFFVHFSSPLRGRKPALLFWLPLRDVINAPPRLARIGKTPAIAPKGWKSFEVPRFDADGNCVGARNPRMTYHDWQNLSPVVVKAGHWSYQGHHDFLTVNIASAVEAAFLEKNELARFIVGRILRFIGLSRVHVNSNWHRLLDREPSPDFGGKRDRTDYGLLVYRSHPSSESVVSRLLDTLTQEGRTLAMQRIFPVLPVRMRWGGSTLLVPPLVREEIRAALGVGDQRRPILLFDDAAITGRTLHDLRSALSALGATRISTMVVANRLRQPADGDGDVGLQYYWRLDLPVMGREGNCPLCHARHLAEGFSNSLSSRNAKEVIFTWGRQWSETSPLDNWSSGLRPLPLATPERDTKYCYRENLSSASEDDKYLARIDLIRSTGLAIHVAELHAMTGRDDYCLKKIKEHAEPEVRVELALSQLLLFGNEFDLDVRVDLVQVLIRELGRLGEDSPHIALTVLAAMWGLGLLDSDSRRKAADTVYEDGWTCLNNYGSRILLAYLASLDLTRRDTDAYAIGTRLLSTGSMSLAQRLSAWYLEILSSQGNPHSEAIPLLMDELRKAIEIKDDLVMGALDSLDRLAELVGGLGRLRVRKDALGLYNQKLSAMSDAAEATRTFLKEERGSELYGDRRDGLKNALTAYLKAMEAVADAYFHRIPSTHDYFKNPTFETITLMRLIARIDWNEASNGKKAVNGSYVRGGNRVIKISAAGENNFDADTGAVWIVWHRGIHGIVLDLMRNAVYATEQIADPWYTASTDQADMWLRVNYGQISLDLILATASRWDPETIFSALKKHRWEPLAELGGSVELERIETPKDLLAVRVRIPYAAYLAS